jgi:signal transduction histidine kinase
MTPETPAPDPQRLGPDANLETVLAAWHGATLRLEQTHEALCDEVRRLTAELEIKNRELARKNRLADLGQMASHIAHEVRNSLVPVTLYLSLLRRRLDEDPGSRGLVDKIRAGMTALDATVNDLLHFTADRDARLQRVALQELVGGVLDSLAPQLQAQGIDVELDIPPRQMVDADPGLLQRAVTNLVLNALDAMPDGGELVITSHAGPGGFELEVADSGPGLSEEVRRRVFEPFFTTKSTGTGLGLAIVYRVAEVHGGDVSVQNCPEGGAAFTIRIPRRCWEAAA